jgi:cell shape-determining protein MreC
VHTQGSTGIFPKGILLGKVKAKRRMENQSLWDIDVLFKEDLRNVHEAFVINALFINEIEQLQQKIPTESIE